MLEEEVRNDKRPPAEVATSLLQFIQNEMPAGGSSAETRFLRIFKFICDRIFGPILDAQGQYKHADGGWLSAMTVPWYPRSASASGNGNMGSPSMAAPSSRAAGGASGVNIRTTSSSSSAYLERDPVVKLLGTAVGSRDADSQPTFIEAISKESANRPAAGFPVPFHAFPETLRESWLAVLEAQLSRAAAPPLNKCSAQTQRLLTELLRRPPLEQMELRMFKQSQAQKKESAAPLMQLSPRGFPAGTSPQAKNTSTNGRDQKKPAEPNVILSMLEYYLFLFLRYPLAKPVRKATTSSSSSQRSLGGSRRESEPYGDTMYFFLFGRYLRHFLPHFKNGPLSKDSELFLRIVVSMWFESQGRCQTTEDVLKRHFRGDAATGANLSLSFDLVQLKYDPPFMQVQKCLLSLVKHLILDPALEVRDGPNYALTPAMSLLQESFYNYVRATFRRAPVHSTQSPFYSALDMWLLWLEPWNVRTQVKRTDLAQNATQRLMGSNASANKNNSMNRSSRTLLKVDHKTPSRYSQNWEAYVAANLHLYTVPLAIFLRRARELDFSASNFNRSLRTVNRVFRVYSPNVVFCLNRLLRREAPEYDRIVNRHVETLGPYAPPNLNFLQLPSCAADMKTLLEEVHLQHSKKIGDLDIFELFEAKLQSMFGGGVISGEEKEMNALIEKARIMVDLPRDYQVVYKSDDASRPTDTSSDRGTLTDGQGNLTAEGFAKVYSGETKCSPADAVFVGDATKSRAGTDELPILLEFFLHMSEWLSLKTGRKVNLRYFANWRHLVQLLVILFVASLVAWLWFF